MSSWTSPWNGVGVRGATGRYSTAAAAGVCDVWLSIVALVDCLVWSCKSPSSGGSPWLRRLDRVLVVSLLVFVGLLSDLHCGPSEGYAAGTCVPLHLHQNITNDEVTRKRINEETETFNGANLCLKQKGNRS